MDNETIQKVHQLVLQNRHHNTSERAFHNYRRQVGATDVSSKQLRAQYLESKWNELPVALNYKKMYINLLSMVEKNNYGQTKTDTNFYYGELIKNPDYVTIMSNWKQPKYLSKSALLWKNFKEYLKDNNRLIYEKLRLRNKEKTEEKELKEFKEKHIKDKRNTLADGYQYAIKLIEENDFNRDVVSYYKKEIKKEHPELFRIYSAGYDKFSTGFIKYLKTNNEEFLSEMNRKTALYQASYKIFKNKEISEEAFEEMKKDFPDAKLPYDMYLKLLLHHYPKYYEHFIKTRKKQKTIKEDLESVKSLDSMGSFDELFELNSLDDPMEGHKRGHDEDDLAEAFQNLFIKENKPILTEKWWLEGYRITNRVENGTATLRIFNEKQKYDDIKETLSEIQDKLHGFKKTDKDYAEKKQLVKQEIDSKYFKKEKSLEE